MRSSAISLAYDFAGRLTNATGVGPSGTVTYASDPAGNLTNAISVTGTRTYSYDEAERLSTLSAPQGTFTFEYSTNNGLVQVASNGTSGVFARYAFDANDRLTNIVWRGSTGVVIRSFAYGLNSADMITNVTRETGIQTRYGYDELDRLTSASSGASVVQYAYDFAGNRTAVTNGGVSTTYSYGSDNRLTSFGTGTSNLFNSAGCITQITYSATSRVGLVWNGLYELTSVATNGVAAESYTFDVFGRRISVTTGTSTFYMVYSGPHVVADVNSAGKLIRSYCWAPGIDQLLAMTVYTGTTAQTYYAIRDHLGSVVALVDSAGTVVEQYEYEAFGRTTVKNGAGTALTQSAYGNRYCFQGREISWATGLYYFRARWLDCVTGRWVSPDPIGISGGLNMYEAMGNNLVNAKDPWGLWEANSSYDYWMGVAESGHTQGGIGGNAQAAGASLMTAFIDFWGTRTLERNAGLSGHYSAQDGCEGKTAWYGTLAVGQIGLSATAAFGGNNAVHPYYRYVGAGSRPLGKGAWLVRGTVGRGAHYGRDFINAADKLQIPPQSMIDDVFRVPGAWKKFIGGPRRVRGNPQWGTGGGTEYRMGMWLWP